VLLRVIFFFAFTFTIVAANVVIVNTTGYTSTRISCYVW